MEYKSIEKTLRDLVRERGLKKTALDLDIDPASLHRSLKDGSNIKLERVKKLLEYLGYDVRIVKSKEKGPRKCEVGYTSYQTSRCLD
jgi:DNA-binding phage protein